jgi:ABC-type branched-subunit amino acid transport system substrate-binding protein
MTRTLPAALAGVVFAAMTACAGTSKSASAGRQSGPGAVGPESPTSAAVGLTSSAAIGRAPSGSPSAATGPAAGLAGAGQRGSNIAGTVVTGPSAASGSGPISQGVTASTITIGILTQNFSNSAANFAVKDGDLGDQQAMAEAVINYLNANGGVAGRKLAAVFYSNDPSNGTFASQAETACAAFTQDHKVFAVMPQTFDMTDMVACLAKHNTPLLTSDNVFGYDADQTEMDQYANYLYAPNTMDLTRVWAHAVDILVNAGFLGPEHKIGLLYVDEPSMQRTLTQQIIPRLAAYGLRLTDTEAAFAANSEADISSDASEVSTTVLRFRSEGIDRVLFLEFAGDLPFLFLPQAQSQGYHPRYGFTTNDMPYWLTLNTPSAQLATSVGVGWIPTQDTNAFDPPGGNATARECLGIMKGAGIRFGDQAAEQSAMDYCGDLFFLKSALDRATSPDPAALRVGVESLGRGWTSPVDLGDTFAPARHDGPDAARMLAYNAQCNCYQYTGATISIG